MEYMLLRARKHKHLAAHTKIHHANRAFASRVDQVAVCRLPRWNINELAWGILPRATAAEDDEADANERRKSDKNASHNKDHLRIGDHHYIKDEEDCIEGRFFLFDEHVYGEDHGTEGEDRWDVLEIFKPGIGCSYDVVECILRYFHIIFFDFLTNIFILNLVLGNINSGTDTRLFRLHTHHNLILDDMVCWICQLQKDSHISHNTENKG